MVPRCYQDGTGKILFNRKGRKERKGFKGGKKEVLVCFYGEDSYFPILFFLFHN
jgi:hypothetical protein